MPDYQSQNASQHLYRQFFNNPNSLHLSSEELEAAAAFFPVVNELIEKQLEKAGRKSDFSDRDPGFQERIVLTRENLKIIVEKFSDSDIACKKFLKVFESFEEKRVTNISKLEGIGDAINTDRGNSNISQITGSSVGFLGCAVIASSLIFPPAAFVLAVGGGVAAGLGAAVTVGTTITEAVLTSQNIGEAQRIVEEDKKEFKEMEDLFTHSIEFVAAVEKVLSISLMEDLARNLRGLFRESTNFHSRFRVAISLFLQELCRRNVSAVLNPFLPIVITTFSVLLVLRKQRHVIYEIMILTSHLFYAFTNGLELGVEVTRIIAQIFMKGGAEAVGRLPANVARVVFHGVFAGLGMALDAINIIYSAIDLSKGSISQHAVAIQNAATALENELGLLRDINNGIKSLNGTLLKM